QLAIAGKDRLAANGDGIDVGRVGGERQLDAVGDRRVPQLGQQKASSLGAFVLHDRGQRFEPFARFLWVEIGHAVGMDAVQANVWRDDSSPRGGNRVVDHGGVFP